MRTRKLLILVGVAFVAFLALLVFLSLGNTSADGGGTRAPGDYRTASNCQSCHSTPPLDEYITWSNTNHAKVFDSNAAFYQAWVAGGRRSSCLPCHVVGYNKTTVAGYDPSLPWNDTYNLPRLGIQCENCHGPDSMSKPSGQRYNTSSSVCYQCHYGSRRPQYDEWNSSAHAKTPPPYVQRLECAGCHEAELAGEYIEGQEPTALPTIPRWQLTCSTCHDPMDAQYEHQLRKPVQELCETCHTSEEAQPGEDVHHPQAEMRNGIGRVPVPSSQQMSAVYCAQCHMYSREYNSSLTPNAMTGHEFTPKPEACVSCHNGVNAFEMNLEQAEKTIEGWQSATESGLGAAREDINDAWAVLNAADEHGFDQATIDKARFYYDQANYSANFVEADGSMGVHNYDYASDLLSFADMRAGEVSAMLTPGTFSGKVVNADGNPLSGVQIVRGTTAWATTGSDGSFSFTHAPGSYTFSLVQGGKEIGSAQGSIVAGQTTDVGKVMAGAGPSPGPAPTTQDQTLQYVTMLLLIIAIVLLIVLMMMQKGKGAKAPARVEKAEEEK